MIDKTVIIGHGPSLQNSNKGEYIDSFKYIIRFPYLKDWQTPKDYGTRTSFFCGTVGRFRKRSRKKQIPDHGYYIWSKEQKFANLPSSNYIDVTDLIVSWQKHITECRHPFFTHGTAGICIAAALLKKPIVVLGCDRLKTGDVTSKKYIGSWVYEGRPRHGIGHPLDQERKIIDKIAKFYNLKIEFE
jgi:hypothetical protein